MFAQFRKQRQQTCGVLHLTGLQNLESVALVGIVPASIQLTQSCELHVVQFSKWGAEHTVWDTVLPNVRSVLLRANGQDFTALPNNLHEASNLMSAKVISHYFGTAAAPLQLHGALEHVEELSMRCVDLHATVPTDVAWRNIDLKALHVLNIRFENISSFVEGNPAFCFRYFHLQVCSPLAQRSQTSLLPLHLQSPNCSVHHQGTALSELAACQMRRHPEWKGHFCEDLGGAHGKLRNLRIRGLGFPLAEPPSPMWQPAHSCCCRACLGCLKGAGIMCL